MNIVIFEDIMDHQMFIVKTIRQYIAKNGFNASVELVTDNMLEIERYIENNQAYTLYFIDIMDKEGNPSGKSLSEKIRQKNPADIIVFVTHYLKEIIYSTEHKMLALNIIPKNGKNAKKEICDTIKHAYSKMPMDDHLVLDSANGDTFRTAFNNIYMIETVKGCHRIRIHYGNGVYECAGLLKEVIPKLDKRFRRCHKSYIVNLDKIEHISEQHGEIVLDNELKIHYAPHYGIEKEL